MLSQFESGIKRVTPCAAQPKQHKLLIRSFTCLNDALIRSINRYIVLSRYSFFLLKVDLIQAQKGFNL